MSFYYLQSIAAVVFTLGLVIILHEFGHFIVCKKLGVRVERFSFGFGPELLGITYGETRYSICAFPLGGFVKPAGEDPEEGAGRPDEYFGQSWNRRLAIVAAGPAMNYLLAFTLFTGVVYVKGMPETGKEAIIGNMMTGFPADAAGMMIDDVVLAVNAKAVTTFDDLANAIHEFPNKEVELTFKRGDQTLKKKLTPRKDEASGEGRIGIMSKPIYTKVGFGAAVYEGVHQCYALTKFTITSISSRIYKRERPDLAGPVGIVQMVSRAAHSGWEDLVFLIGLLSVAIGFFNILPVPLLDGGHGAMYLWEGLSGKKLTPKAMSVANSAGIFFLLSLLVFATFNDFTRIMTDRKLRKNATAPIEVKP